MRIITSTLLSIICLAAHAEDLIRLGNLKFAHYGAVSYIKEIAPQCGFRVEERLFSKGVDMLPAILAGELDVAASASDAAIVGRSVGAPIYAVAGFSKGGARLVARTDQPIQSLADLKGKTVGVTRGGAHELLLAAELAQAGLTWSDQAGSDVRIIYLGFSELNQALAARQIDAMMQSEPYSAQAINKKLGIEVMKPYDTPLGEPVRALVMTESLYQKRDIALKFMQCFVRATRMFQKHPHMAERYVRHTLFKGQVSHDDYEAAIANAPYSLDLSESHIQITTDLMMKYGIGRMTAPPRAQNWVKLDVLEEAKRLEKE
ncbi:ABC transporter substrate-binding protein [Burkholderiaceae bacterium DAT-1]|nr:ABC transporter substrate-binding protein [Burkholderiaceae bacterium DAT-1]